MSRQRAVLLWSGLVLAIAVPLVLAAQSPLLAWRAPIYIFSGFAGMVALIGLLLQPLLAAGALPGVSRFYAQRLHRLTGAIIASAVVLHVGGLWITSPPDVIDALLLRSPTPFSLWGVLAMWAVFANLLLAVIRRPLGLRLRHWRAAHLTLSVFIALCTILHVLLIEGTMEIVSKTLLCLLLLVVVCKGVWAVWFSGKRP